jgi:hypothetical protein
MFLASVLKWVSGGLLFLWLITLVGYQVERRGHAKAKERIVELVQLREADRRSYTAAQAEAKARNIAEVARIEQRQKEVTHEVVSDYRRQLADLRLRAQARANPGVAGGSRSPAIPAAPGGADEDGLRVSERLQAEEIELRLMHLQNWIERQSR